MRKHSIILKRITAACLACAALLFSSICAAADNTEYVTVESAVPRKVLVIGDSITTGYGLEGYEKGRDNVESYANLLKREFESELKDGKEEFINKGIDGQTSPELLESLNKGEYDADLKDCDLVLISIGGNDLMHTLFGFFSGDSENSISISDVLKDHSVGDLVEILSDLSKVLEEKLIEYDSNIRDITDYINDKSDARVIVQTLYNPLDTREKPKLFMAFVKSKITTLNEKMLANAKDEQGNERYEIADVFTAFAGQGDKLTNINKIDIHPNAEGHKKIYETLDAVIRSKSFTIKVEKPKAEKASAEATETDSSDSGKDNDTKSTILIACGGAVLAAAVIIIVITTSRKDSK